MDFFEKKSWNVFLKEKCRLDFPSLKIACNLQLSLFCRFLPGIVLYNTYSTLTLYIAPYGTYSTLYTAPVRILWNKYFVSELQMCICFSHKTIYLLKCMEQKCEITQGMKSIKLWSFPVWNCKYRFCWHFSGQTAF